MARGESDTERAVTRNQSTSTSTALAGIYTSTSAPPLPPRRRGESSVEGRHNGVVPSVGPVVAGRAMSRVEKMPRRAPQRPRRRDQAQSTGSYKSRPSEHPIFLPHQHRSSQGSQGNQLRFENDHSHSRIRQDRRKGRLYRLRRHGPGSLYGEPVDQPTVNEVLSRCLEDGATFWDTSDVYSP